MEKKSNEIALTDISKSVSVGELEGIISVLKARQKFFEGLVRESEGYADKAIAKLEQAAGNMPEPVLEKLKLLSNEFAKQMNLKIVKDFQEELDAQEDVNEFLFRFTGEKQVNYKNILLNGEDLTTI